MPSLFSRRAWTATIAVFFFFILASPFLIIVPQNVKATSPGFISVSGTQFTMDGVSFSSSGTRLVGLDETTAVAMAIRAHVSGLTGEWGKNMNFPVPDTGKLNVNNLTQLWYAYFWFCAHYNINLVRFSSGDQWATSICYKAWRDHPTQYFQVLDEMLKQAYARGIYIELNMAGGCEGAAPNYFYNFEQPPSSMSDQLTDLNKAEGKVYHYYLDYITATIQHLDASPYTNAIFAYDLYNEPDASLFWAHNQVKFRTWARVIANDTTILTDHIVDMGVGCGGDFAGNFGWGLASFQNATGWTGFDICHRHDYGSAEDDYLVRDPLHWSMVHCGKPLLTGEIGKSYYADGRWHLERWPWWETRYKYYGGQAHCSMVLLGTIGYPYSGDYPIGQTAPPTPTPPTISISADINYGPVSLIVNFTSLVTNGIVPYTYLWTFGDGGTNTNANPSHAYGSPGTFNAHCTVSGGGSGVSNMITVVTYAPSPTPPPAPPTPPPLPPAPPPLTPLTPGPNAPGTTDVFIITNTNGTSNDIISQAGPFLGVFAFFIAILAVIAVMGQVSRF